MKPFVLSALTVVVCGIVTTTTVMAESNTQQKILELKREIINMQNKGKLGFNNVTFCSEIQGFGMYTPLPGSTVPGKEFYVYYEPANPYTKVEGGKYSTHLTQDLYLLDTKGNVLFGKEKALQFYYEAVAPVLDIYISNTITLTDAPKGKYVWKAVLHDELRGENVTITKEFVVE
jgi:hypothetical protein